MTLLQAIILAIIEGITEFLPVSSTGHMIIGSALMGIEKDEFVKLFTVAIQFGTILSVAMLLRWSLKLEAEAAAIEAAVAKVLDQGLRTSDIAAGGPAVGTQAMTAAIVAVL